MPRNKILKENKLDAVIKSKRTITRCLSIATGI